MYLDNNRRGICFLEEIVFGKIYVWFWVFNYWEIDFRKFKRGVLKGVIIYILLIYGVCFIMFSIVGDFDLVSVR